MLVFQDQEFVKITWVQVNQQISGFQLQRVDEGGLNPKTFLIANGLTNFIDNSVVINKKYIYTLNAIAGENLSNSLQLAITVRQTVPLAPSNLTGSALVLESINLRWVDNSNNETGFKIDRKSQGGVYSQIATVGAGVVTFTDIGLTSNTSYSYRVYSYNNAGSSLSYSNEFTISSLAPVVPTLTTTEITQIESNGAKSGGNVSSDGGSAVTARGVVWGTSVNPTISLTTKTSNGIGSGSFTSDINGLNRTTIYYVRAYAKNAAGTAYGPQVSFKTLESNTVVDIDGNVYTTVTIGSQVWMVENLKTTKFRNGDPIPYYTRTSTRGYCWYNDDAANKNKYGSIYNYYTAMDSRSISPPGWHIPTIAEWTTLVNFLGGSSVAGGKMKQAGTTNWTSPNTNATNSSGFTALPGGVRDCSNNFVLLGTHSSFWISAPAVSGTVQLSALFSNSGTFFFQNNFDCNANYVRCIKD